MILVTGAGGHLGQWVVAHLSDEGRDVLCVSRHPPAAPTIPGVHWPRPVRTLAVDLGDRSSVSLLRPMMKSIEGVLHLAAFIPTDTALSSHEQARTCLRHNAVATCHLLDELAHAPRLVAVILASTFEVYGRPRTCPMDESHPTEPVTAYGASKLVAEKYLALFACSRDVRAAALRLATIYGPGDRLVRAVGNFARAAATSADIVVHGDGSDMRDLVYVQDAAQALVMALDAAPTGVLNVGSGAGTSIASMGEAANRASGGKSRVVHAPRAKERIDVVLDSSAAIQTLGWRARTSLDDGMGAFVASI